MQAPVTYLHPVAREPFYQLLIFEDPCSHLGWNGGLQIWETLGDSFWFAHSSSCGEMIGQVSNIKKNQTEYCLAASQVMVIQEKNLTRVSKNYLTLHYLIMNIFPTKNVKILQEMIGYVKQSFTIGIFLIINSMSNYIGKRKSIMMYLSFLKSITSGNC